MIYYLSSHAGDWRGGFGGGMLTASCVGGRVNLFCYFGGIDYFCKTYMQENQAEK